MSLFVHEVIIYFLRPFSSIFGQMKANNFKISLFWILLQNFEKQLLCLNSFLIFKKPSTDTPQGGKHGVNKDHDIRFIAFSINPSLCGHCRYPLNGIFSNNSKRNLDYASLIFQILFVYSNYSKWKLDNNAKRI